MARKRGKIQILFVLFLALLVLYGLIHTSQKFGGGTFPTSWERLVSISRLIASDRYAGTFSLDETQALSLIALYAMSAIYGFEKATSNRSTFRLGLFVLFAVIINTILFNSKATALYNAVMALAAYLTFRSHFNIPETINKILRRNVRIVFVIITLPIILFFGISAIRYGGIDVSILGVLDHPTFVLTD